VRVVVLLERAAQGQDVEAGSAASSNYRFGLVRLNEQVPDPRYAVLTVLHEVVHALGATDKYDDSFRAVFPDGYAEPYRDPLHPQRFAEIMAVDLPLSISTEREPDPLTEVRVGHVTAAELVWLEEPEMLHCYRGLGGRAGGPGGVVPP
jgi:hypothetical protein